MKEHREEKRTQLVFLERRGLRRRQGFLGSAPRSEGVAQPLTDRHLLLPLARAKRATPAYRQAKGFQFRLGLRDVDVLAQIFR